MDFAVRNNQSAKENYAMTSLWEAVDLFLLREGIDSPATSFHRPSHSETDDGDEIIGSELESASDGEKITEENEDGELVINNRSCEQDGSDGDSDSESEEGEEESGGEESEDAEDESDEDDSIDEYKKDLYDGEESLSDRNDDASSLSSTAYPTKNGQSHEMFLPRGISPSVAPLKYEEDKDERSGDENDDPSSCYSRRSRMIENYRSGSPRISDDCPPCVFTSSDSSSEESQTSAGVKDKTPSKRGGISFSRSVTVFPIFGIDAYPIAAIQKIYAGRKEIRLNKIRNQREYAHDKRDWRNATEEEDMVSDDEGELVHPASGPRRAKRSIIQIHPPSEMRDVSRFQAGRRGKRMRMWHP